MRTVSLRARIAMFGVAIATTGSAGCASIDPGSGGSNGAGNQQNTETTPDTVPSFNGAVFSDPATIDHPYFPQEPGTTRTYRSIGGDTVEETVIEVLLATREVAGIDCRVVRDRVYVDGQLIEDTFDWYAQDDDGNVWYMGEEVTDFEYDESGFLVGIEHGGAWETGKDVKSIGVVAVPGYQMPAMPSVGTLYHQEYYQGEAEDTGEIVEVDVAVTLDDGSEYVCIKTEDASTADPTIFGYKYYAPGVGVVLEEEGDERVELTHITTGDEAPVALREAKLIIEHNATAEDTGFQAFIDSEGWERLDVTGPGGAILTFQGRGLLGGLGLTELFFETVEPPNADVPIEDILTVLPEGEYTFQGPTPDGPTTAAKATLTHNIPAGPELLTPAEGAVVPTDGLVMSWNPVTETITGEPVNIIRYQLIVSEIADPHANAIGKLGLSIYVPATVTSITVPSEMLESQTDYEWEVLAIEESGNQTLSSSEFSTE